MDRVERTLAAPAGSIRIDATIADVTVVGSDRADVAVELVRHAPAAADLSRLPATIEPRGDDIGIAALQAADGRDPQLRADVLVKAPAATRFDAIRVFEGRVRISGLTNACDVDVRRGNIEADGLAGRVRLETGIGGIEVRRPSLVPGGMLRLRAFNGPVRVRFERAPANARILALTFNGAIASDIPLAMKDQFGPRFGEATLGSGEPVMSIDVVTGDISIRVGR